MKVCKVQVSDFFSGWSNNYFAVFKCGRNIVGLPFLLANIYLMGGAILGEKIDFALLEGDRWSWGVLGTIRFLSVHITHLAGLE